MARRNPPACTDCKALILWAHDGPKDEKGTRWIKLDPGTRTEAECLRPVPYEDQPRHKCGAAALDWLRRWGEAWAGIGYLAHLEGRLARLDGLDRWDTYQSQF